MELSDMAKAPWAKSDEGRTDGAFLPLHQHMRDALDVGTFLLDEWLPASLLDRLAQMAGTGQDRARAILRFLVMTHDVGKASPAFATKAWHLVPPDAGLLRGLPAAMTNTHHTLIGYHALKDWLVSTYGAGRRAADSWAAVTMSHHGSAATGTTVLGARPGTREFDYGGSDWQSARDELLTWAAAECGIGPDDAAVTLPLPFQVVASGLTILADWIASNEDFFDYSEPTQDRATHGLAKAALPPRWRASAPPRDPAAHIAARFSLPPGATARPSQAGVIEAAWTVDEPALLLLEAPMGEGKTEGALAAAEVLAHRFDLGGVLLALPTRATSNAIFDRMIAWVNRLPERDVELGISVFLDHAQRELHARFADLKSEARVEDLEGDPSAASVNAYLAGHKRHLLSTMVTATVDQLLLTALSTKHVMLRHLAIAGKVLVVDEVHAYDAFMQSHLEAALRWAGAYRVPVVLLSATLPPATRAALVGAYTGGIAPQPSDAYPALTVATPDRVETLALQPSARRLTYRLDCLEDDDARLAELLAERLADGGCALVIRNTVRRVNATAAALHERLSGVPVTTAHARFTNADRARKDSELLDLFGPPGRCTGRPERHVVVASQVVEQSLDVDFDVLVTDLAPVDLVLQRMGRCHRHDRPRPPRLAEPQVFVTGLPGPDAAAPPVVDAGSTLVYSLSAPGGKRPPASWPLLRAAAVLRDRVGGTVTVPDDIVPLVHSAYDPQASAPVGWEAATREAWAHQEASREEVRRTAALYQVGEPGSPSLKGWFAHQSDGDEDSPALRALTRLTGPSLDVLVTWRSPEGALLTAPPGDERGVLLDPGAPLTRDQRLALARQSVSIPVHNPVLERAVEAAAPMPSAWRQPRGIREQPVLTLDDEGVMTCGPFRISYSASAGLEVS